MIYAGGGSGGNYMMELNKQIKKYRTMMNLSQEELAEQLGISRQTLSKYETGVSHS